MLTPKVKHFVFESQQQPPFDYIPGQFITLVLDMHGKVLKRSYSIANPPTHNNLLEFSAGFVENGAASQFLFNLQPGAVVLAAGPFGRLVLKNNLASRYILVGTSTGMTPYRAMLTQLMQAIESNPQLSIIILQGVRTRRDALFVDEFLALCAQSSQVSVQIYYSQEADRDLQAHEHHGYVQTAFAKLNLHPQQDMVYLCGNPGMIDDAFTLLKTNNFPVEQVIREKYISN